MHADPQKSFLTELQSLDEPTKRKIMIVGTIVVMSLIIYVWLGYFNSFVMNGVSSGSNVETSTIVKQSSGGFWAGVKDFFQGGGQYIVKPK